MEYAPFLAKESFQRKKKFPMHKLRKPFKIAIVILKAMISFMDQVESAAGGDAGRQFCREFPGSSPAIPNPHPMEPLPMKQTISITLGSFDTSSSSPNPATHITIQGGDNSADTAVENDESLDSTSTFVEEKPEKKKKKKGALSAPPAHPHLPTTLAVALLLGGGGFGLLALILLAALVFGVPVSIIVIGALHTGVGACFEERIAICLILGGVFSILHIVVRAALKASLQGEDDEDEGQRDYKGCAGVLWFLHLLIAVVDCVWVIVASVFVYRIWRQVDLENFDSEFYCNRTLYLVAFSYLTICWIFFGAYLTLWLIIWVYSRCICIFQQIE